MNSPGSTTGLSALASSLMFSTSTPRSCATLFRLKSLVTIFPWSVRPSSISFRSTSRIFGKVDVGDRDVDAGHLLDLLEDVEAAAAAVALERVGRIGDELQLLQHELRDHERAVEKPGLADIGDPAVDDDAGIEDAVALLRPGVAEQADQPLGLQPLPFARAHDDPEVGEDEQDEAVEEDDAADRRCSAQNSAAPIVFERPSPMAPPMSAPSRSVTSVERSRVSTKTMKTPRTTRRRY